MILWTFFLSSSYEWNNNGLCAHVERISSMTEEQEKGVKSLACDHLKCWLYVFSLLSWFSFYDFMAKVNSQPEPNEYLHHFSLHSIFPQFSLMSQRIVFFFQQQNEETQLTNDSEFIFYSTEFITNTATSKTHIWLGSVHRCNRETNGTAKKKNLIILWSNSKRMLVKEFATTAIFYDYRISFWVCPANEITKTN